GHLLESGSRTACSCSNTSHSDILSGYFRTLPAMQHLSFGTVLWLSMATAASGRDIYVNNLTGDDHFNGEASVIRTPSEGPTRSIAKALRRALPGDRIVVANTEVPYRESISLWGEHLSGGPAGPLVIEGNGATLDGSA